MCCLRCPTYSTPPEAAQTRHWAASHVRSSLRTTGPRSSLRRTRSRSSARSVFKSWNATGFWRSGASAAPLSLGKGVSALFAGPSGTGKTMAAEIIARELGLDLYKIDLSGVVSASTSAKPRRTSSGSSVRPRTRNAILFFDEADALFGKRSEVRDSHDRYANIEIAYLLQRMEQYDGVAILATNLRAEHGRRIRAPTPVRRRVPVPDEDERARIWPLHFPGEAERDAGIDFVALARRSGSPAAASRTSSSAPRSSPRTSRPRSARGICSTRRVASTRSSAGSSTDGRARDRRERGNGLSDLAGVDVLRGLLYVHNRANANTGELHETRSTLDALVDLLVDARVLDRDALEERRADAAACLRDDFVRRGMAVAIQEFGVSKYDFEGAAEIDCETRLPLCRAACCKLPLALSAEDVEEGVVRWDLGHPYMIAHGDDHYCVHMDRRTHRCGVYEQRPIPCRGYDCRRDEPDLARLRAADREPADPRPGVAGVPRGRARQRRRAHKDRCMFDDLDSTLTQLLNDAPAAELPELAAANVSFEPPDRTSRRRSRRLICSCTTSARIAICAIPRRCRARRGALRASPVSASHELRVSRDHLGAGCAGACHRSPPSTGCWGRRSPG